MEQLLQVGVITSMHGLRGEVKVFPTTDDARRFKKRMELILNDGTRQRTLEVEAVKFFKRLVILKFKGVDTIEEMERYRGQALYVARENAVPLGRDEYFVADLIGMDVQDEDGGVLGVLTDVLETGANDVYCVRTPENKELLLPAIRECILSVDPQRGLIRVRLMPGLLE